MVQNLIRNKVLNRFVAGCLAGLLVAGCSKPSEQAAPAVRSAPSEIAPATDGASAATPAARSDPPPSAAALEAAHAAASMQKKKNQLEAIGKAIVLFQSQSNDRYPTIENAGLSWRVTLLPVLDSVALIRQFNRGEAWDSPHNKAVIGQMPDVFKTPEVTESGKTCWIAFRGEGTVLGGKSRVTSRDVTDGLQQTIVVAEAAPEKAITWTQPDEATFDPDNPKAALGKHPGKTFLVLYADGHIGTLPTDIDPQAFKALLTFAGGEKIDAAALKPEKE